MDSVRVLQGVLFCFAAFVDLESLQGTDGQVNRACLEVF